MSDESGFNDSSIMRTHELSSSYEELRSQNREQFATIEALQQEVHSLKQRLQVAEKIQVEYQSELECLQQQTHEASDLASATALRLKEDHSLVVQELEDKILNLEFELQEAAKVQASDREELLKARKEIKEFQDASPVATLKAELQEMMEEHAANRVACVQHLELNQVLLKEKNYLMEEVKSMREHLEMTEEKLKICKDDMMQQSETIEDLRESLAVTQNELTCLQSGPRDEKSRGNSLFAEVEDKRQAMLKQSKVLTKKYAEMKSDYGAKCAEISKLKMENLQLRRKWREEAEERDNRDVWLNDNYEIRIKELNKLVEDLKRQENPVFINGNSHILAYAESWVTETKKKMVHLQEEMELRSVTRLNEAKALHIARSKVQTLKAEVMVLNAENIVLRDKLAQANITDIPSPGKTLQRIKEVWESVTACQPKCDQPPNEMFDSCNHGNQATSPRLLKSSSPVKSCDLIDEVPENGNTQKPTVCHEVTNTGEDIIYQSQSEEFSDPSPIPSRPMSIASHLSNIPKPQRLIRTELMEKLLSEGTTNNTSEEKTPPESHVFCVSPDISDDQLMDEALINPQKFVSILEKSSHKTYENVKNNEATYLPIHLGHSGEHVRSLDEELQLFTFNSPTKQAVLSEDNTVGSPALVVNEDSPVLIPTLKESCEVTNENWIVPAEGTKKPPRQSILIKPARPSLMPVDQNLMRRVRFADSSDTSGQKEENQSNDQKPCPIKKLPRAPKTYKTKFIASKDLD